jgi:Fe-S-cluster containining protein
MSGRRIELGFERTVCDCEACKLNCKFIPGFLIPSDLQRLTEHLGYKNPVEFAVANLLASPGATVMRQGRILQIPTLVPARGRNGACLFLDEESRCRIHSVSPFGCCMFDAHQSKEESDRRSSAGHYEIALAWKNMDIYARIWLLLHELGCVAPSPIEARARMQTAIETSDPSSFPQMKTDNV